MALPILVLITEIILRQFPISTEERAIAVVCQSLFCFFIFVIPSIRFFKSLNKIKLYFIIISCLCLLSFFSSDPVISFNNSFKYFFSLLTFFLGYYCISNIRDVKLLFNNIYLINILFLIYILFCNYFKIGYSAYVGQEFLLGYLEPHHYEVCFFIMMLSPLLFSHLSKTKRIFIYTISLIIFLFLIPTGRRSFLFIVLAGLSINIFYKQSNAFIKFGGIMLSLLLFFIIPMLIDSGYFIFFDQVRSEHITGSNLISFDRIIREPRITEYYYVFQVISDNVVNLLFGSLEVFNSIDNYGFTDIRRHLHSDYSRILFSFGFVGLFVYFLFYWSIFKAFFNNLKQYNNNSIFRKIELKKFFIIIIIFIIVNGFTGGITYVFNRSFLTLLLGVAIKISEINDLNQDKQRNLVS